MASSTRTTEMKHPKTGDVRRIPDELVKTYESRGWEKTKASSKTSSTSGSTSSK